MQFSSGSYSVNENTGTATITATLSAPSALTVTVVYTTGDGTATAGSDYAAASGTLTFAPGQISQSFVVSITNDIITNEFNETVILTLSNPINATLGPPNPATLTIADDDGQPTVGFVVPEYSVNEGDDEDTGLVTSTIVVTLSAPSALTVTVTYNTSDGTATAPGDYTPAGGTLTFTPGQTGRSFNVMVISDTTIESNETINLTLSNPTSATLGLSNATLTIIDDDGSTSCTSPVPSTPGEPDIGPPDGQIANVDCGTALVVTLTKPVQTSGDSAFDVVYYEFEPTPGGVIRLDWVIVQVGAAASGPWYTVFYWGDGILDSNTNIGQAGYCDGVTIPCSTAEDDNQAIPTTDPPLYGTPPYVTGIAIDVDARAPAGTYGFVRIFSPFGGGGDTSEVDAIQPLPWP